MTKRIKVDELPVFDATSYLDSEEAIASYLTDIAKAAGITREGHRVRFGRLA
jgi:DNA-binding phage protein